MPVRMRAATYKMPEADFERLMDIIKTDETQYVYTTKFSSAVGGGQPQL